MTIDSSTALPLGAAFVMMGTVWGIGNAFGAMKAKLSQHDVELKALSKVFTDFTEIKESVAWIKGYMKGEKE